MSDEQILTTAVHVMRHMQLDGSTTMSVEVEGEPTFIEILGLLEYAKLEIDRHVPDACDCDEEEW